MNNTYTDIYGNVLDLSSGDVTQTNENRVESEIPHVHCELCDAEIEENRVNSWTSNWKTFRVGDSERKYVCSECARKYQLLGYSEEHGIPFEKLVMEDEIGTENNIFLYGYELETETDNNYYYSVNNRDTIYLMNYKMRKYFIDNIKGRVAEDGSLGCNGQEFIPDPRSERRFYEDAERYVKPFMDEMASNHYVSHNGGRCGLHFHVSKNGFTRNDYVERILCILENFKDEIKNYSRRNNFGWCKFLSDNVNNCYCNYRPDFEEELKTTKYYKDNMFRFNQNDHHAALNIRDGRPTIEFRFMRGTLNYNSFMASFELIRNIVKLADGDKELDEITWGDLVDGEYARVYAQERGLAEYNKKCVDYTNAIAKKLEKKVEYERKMLSVLENNVRTLLNAIRLDKSTYENISDLTNRTRNTINELNILQQFSDGINVTQNAILSNVRYTEFLAKLENTLRVLDGRKRNTKILKNKIEKLKKEFEELGVMDASSSNQ